MRIRSTLLTLSALTACCFVSTSMAWPGWKDYVTINDAYITGLSFDGGVIASETGSSSFSINAAYDKDFCTTWGWSNKTYCESPYDGQIHLNLSNGMDTCSITLLEGSNKWNAAITSTNCHGSFTGASLSYKGYYYTLTISS